MIAKLIVLIALAATSNGPRENARFTEADGRASSLQRVLNDAERCGIKGHLETMRGPMFFHRPDEPGGELLLRTFEATPSSQRCFQRRIGALRKRYPDLTFLPDTVQ